MMPTLLCEVDSADLAIGAIVCGIHCVAALTHVC